MAAYQDPQKSMLDWLIPSQLQSDITSPMLNIEDYYERIFAPQSTGSDEFWEYHESPTYSTGSAAPSEEQIRIPYEDLSEGDRERLRQHYEKYKSSINIFSGEDVLSNLGGGIGKAYQSGDWGDEEPLTTSSIQAFKPSDFRPLHTGFYTKDVLEPGREELENIFAGRKGKVSALGGDIARYGARSKFQDIAKETFHGGVKGLYSQIDEFKRSALNKLYGQLDEWKGMVSAYGDE